MNAVRGAASEFVSSPSKSSGEEEFDETGPRPPTLPGKEQDPQKRQREALLLSLGHEYEGGRGSGAAGRTFAKVPSALTPRNSSRWIKPGRSLEGPMSYGGRDGSPGDLDGEPPLGYEPEGSARGSTPPLTFRDTRTPPYLRWAETLRELLGDGEGVELFKRYLQMERCEDSLNFWFACEGLKKKAPAGNAVYLQQLIKVIYRTYLRSNGTITICAPTRRSIVDKMAQASETTPPGPPDCSIFDGAQREVEEHIDKSTYPNFLKSDLYLQYVQSMQQMLLHNGHSATSCSPPSRYGDDSVTSATSSASASVCCSLPSSRSSSSGGRPEYGGMLPTVMEDCELNVTTPGPGSTATGDASLVTEPLTPLPLTSRHLMATQHSRAGFLEARRPEAFAGLYLQQSTKSAAPNPYHAMYSTFIPASAQDSELQSLSSGAHTDDTISLTDSSVDGAPTIVNRKHLKQQHRAMRQNANQNRDPLSHQTMIPRTQRAKEETVNPKDVELFAAVLIKKLEVVKASQDCLERMDASLRKLEYEENKSYSGAPVERHDAPQLVQQRVPAGAGPHEPPMAPIPSALLSVAMREKLAAPEDVQSILDDHVSRIWDDSAHQSPAHTPGLRSPAPPPHHHRPRSPDRRRVSAPPLLHLHAAHQRQQHRSRDRDGASLFSGDSGAVPDFVDSEAGARVGSNAGSLGFAGMGGGPPLAQPSQLTVHHHKHYHSVKSKVIGELVDMPRSGPAGAVVDPYAAGTGDLAQQRRARGEAVGKARQGVKKFQDSSSSGIDSGVSVVYEPSQGIGFNSQEKVMSWVLDSEKYCSHVGDSEKETSSRHKKSSYSSTISTASPGPNRQGRGKKSVVYSTSRSGSLERGSHSSSWNNPLPQPSQPFMSDPSMPILPPPNTTTQLEEARRRLEDDTKNKLSKSRSGLSSKDRAPYLDLAKSSSRSSSGKLPMTAMSVETFVDENPLNLRKSSSKKPSSSTSTPSIAAPSASASSTAEALDYTVVLYNFSGESVPYRSKLAGKNIVLRQFKSLITKKGNFRYFFKSFSDDVDTGFVYEEANDDNDLLPLWDGKIFALLESVD